MSQPRTPAANAQLRAIAAEYHAASQRLRRLVEAVPAERWSIRADPDRWSVGECVVHLNLTSKAYREIVGRALAEGEAAGRRVDPNRTRYRRDPLGWMLWKTMGPPVRFKVKTLAPFVPGATQPREDAVAEFERLQLEQLRWLERADTLPLEQLRVKSPFDPRGKLTYNLFSCLSILPRHQHRHLWQAEQVWAANP
jgi:hypothetical protein